MRKPILWIEGPNRSTMKNAAVYLLLSFGFFAGYGLHAFIVWSDKFLKG